MRADDAIARQEAVQAEVYAALSAAAAGTGLCVARPPGLAGAYIYGHKIEAYVIATPGGYKVDLWRRTGNNPFRVEPATDLRTAVDTALTAAAPRRVTTTSGGTDSPGPEA